MGHIYDEKQVSGRYGDKYENLELPARSEVKEINF